MTLRRRLLLYLVLLHLVLGALGVALLWQDHRPWIMAVELFLIVSLYLGIRFTSGFQQHIEIVTTGAEFIREEDFTHTFTEVDAADVNDLVRLYNEMIRRLREERLKQHEQHAFLTRVLEASPTGMLTLDLDGRIDIANPVAARLLERSLDTLHGTPLNQIDSKIAEALHSLAPDTSQMVSLGGRRRIKCTHSHFYEQGFAHSFFLIEELTDELWRSEKKAYETLIRTLSHEVNNTVGASNSILRSSLAFGEQLREGDRQDFEKAITVAIERTDHLNAFMRGFADVIRLPEPNRRPTDLVELLERIVTLHERECGERNIALRLDCSEEKVVVSLDVVQVEQALVNVMRNAIEAVDQDGSIRLAVRLASEGWELVVEDSGPGLSEEARQNLFIPFFSTKQHGQGIGLTLVHEILTRHHFACSLDSDPGQPTRFKVVMGR
ncbi:hypothetical protein KQI63_05205 [bacterium]|nr:hypothetical protein [bacterium]